MGELGHKEKGERLEGGVKEGRRVPEDGQGGGELNTGRGALGERGTGLREEIEKEGRGIGD